MVGVEVTVSLTYEAGRDALVSRAATYEQLRENEGVEVVELDARADFYAPASRDALHRLERRLFEAVEAEPVEPGDAVRLLGAGGERAEIELVGAEIATLLRDGYAAGDVAVVFRSLRTVAPLVEEVFGAYAIPCAIDRRLAVGHTALGRGLIGLLRSALPAGHTAPEAEARGADDLLAYLRTPGVLDRPELGDLLEAELRRRGIRSAAEARRAWEQAPWGWPLDAVRRVERAIAAGPSALCARLAREASILLTRPHRGQAPVLDAEEELDARVAGELGRALRELAELAKADPRLVPPAYELAQLLARIEVRVGPQPGPGLVAVTTPLRLRARRVRALFVCGLQEGAFPAPARPDPLLGDEERSGLARASGLVLRQRGDTLANERYCLLCRRDAPDRPARAQLARRRRRRRAVDAVVFRRRRRRAVQPVADRAHASAPSRRGRLAGGDGADAARGAPCLGCRAGPASGGCARARYAPSRCSPSCARWPAFSASGLETWASCPMRWLIERYIDPDELQPDPEPMLRGTLAHRVLRDVLAALGSRPLRPDDLPAARRALGEALARARAGAADLGQPRAAAGGAAPTRGRPAALPRRRVDAGSAFAPTLLERSFETEIAGGVALRGTIDRIDLHGEQAIVYDYKGRSATPVARWASDRKLQIGLYVLAVA